MIDTERSIIAIDQMIVKSLSDEIISDYTAKHQPFDIEIE